MDIFLADDRPSALPGLEPRDVLFERVETTGPVLDTCYELFRRVFDPSVLDSFETYQRRMSPEARDMREYLPCYVVASAVRGDSKIVLGFISSDVMRTSGDDAAAFHAIGNIATSPLAKERGLRGIGSGLLRRATEEAARESERDGKRLLCVVTEAEPASLGFWKKEGFLWPKGCTYLQPPLDFDATGEPLYKEVPETLLVKPLAIGSRSISSRTTLEIIRTIYENWCLRGWRDVLSIDAMKRAEDYVMSHVYEQVVRRMPGSELVLSDDIPAAR